MVHFMICQRDITMRTLYNVPAITAHNKCRMPLLFKKSTICSFFSNRSAIFHAAPLKTWSDSRHEVLHAYQQSLLSVKLVRSYVFPSSVIHTHLFRSCKRFKRRCCTTKNNRTFMILSLHTATSLA